MSDIKLITKGYKQKDDLDRVAKYIIRERETDDPNEVIWWDGLGVGTDSIEEALFDMRLVKNVYGKTEGKQLWQLIVSIDRYMYLTSSKEFEEKRGFDLKYARLIGMDVCEYIYNEGYQNIFGIHTDTNHIHLHYLINSVNIFTGNHIRNAYTFEKNIREVLSCNYPKLQWNTGYMGN